MVTGIVGRGIIKVAIEDITYIGCTVEHLISFYLIRKYLVLIRKYLVLIR